MIKMTPEMLRQLITEELKKFGAMRDVKKVAAAVPEFDADEFAKALEKHVDYVKSLKLFGADDEKRFAPHVKTLSKKSKK